MASSSAREALFGVREHARPTIERGCRGGGGWAQGPGRPPATTPRSRRSTASRAAAATAGVGRRVGHLLDQVGHRLHRAHEVARGQLADVAGGHGEGGGERGPAGPGGHGGGQTGRGLAGAGHQVGLLDPRMRSARALTASQRRVRSSVRAPPRRSGGRRAAFRERWPWCPWWPGTRRARRGSKTTEESTPANTAGSAPARSVAAERLGDEEVGLVVDPREAPAGGRQRPAVDVAHAAPGRRPGGRAGAAGGRACAPATGRTSAASTSSGRVAWSKRATRLTARL